ncbi:MAG: WYL domain-containing protein [Bacteroidota bacterium]
MRSRERVLKLVVLILGRPYQYTRLKLAKKYRVSKNTIDEDLKQIEQAGIIIEHDYPHYRLAILPDKSFKELEHLMPLTAAEQDRIKVAIDKNTGSSVEADKLKRKVSSLYDFQRLGIRALRRPELEKLDLLKAGRENEKRVILENYRSNSNEIKNRYVEPFDIDPEYGMLQAYDTDDQESKHFKISRIERIELTEIPWGFKHKHNYKYTDVFRIADNNKEMVHMKLDIYAYNALVENYPKARSEIMPGIEKNTYNFQSRVNANFLGLTNFILGNWGHIHIISPDNLKEHILKKAQKIIDTLKAEE